MADLVALPVMPQSPHSILRPNTFNADADATFAQLVNVVATYNANVPIFNASASAAVASASAAALSQSAASTSATASSESATLAQNWATSLVVVSGGLYGARYYAQLAQAAVAALPAGAINDLMTATDKTWSSTKISTDKQDVLVSGVNIKTINGASLLSSGDLVLDAPQTGDVRITYATSMPTGWIRSGKVYLSASYPALSALVGSRVNITIKNSNDTGPSYPAFSQAPIAASANCLMAGTGGTGFIYRTTAASAAWTYVSTSPMYVYGAVKSPAETDRFAVSVYNAGSYYLGYTNTAAGAPTSVLVHGYSAGGSYMWYLCATATFILAQSYGYASNNKTYVRSTSATASYTAYTNGTTDMFTTNWPAMCTDGSSVWVWKYGTGDIYKTNDGIVWTTLTNCGVTYGRIYCAHGRLVVVSSASDRTVAVSLDGGVTWTNSQLPSGYSHETHYESVYPLANPSFLVRLRDASSNTRLFLTSDFVTYVALTEFASSSNNFQGGIYLPSVQRFVAPRFDDSAPSAGLNWSPYSYTTGTQFFLPTVENGWVKT